MLGIRREEICIDLYGDRNNRYAKRYYLSVRPRPYKVLRSFGLAMRPVEANILHNMEGHDIFLYDTTQKGRYPKSDGLTHRVMYYQKGFNSLFIWQLFRGNLSFLCATAINRLRKKLRSR